MIGDFWPLTSLFELELLESLLNGTFFFMMHFINFI